jgi:putative salt-induced outer membrane protein
MFLGASQSTEIEIAGIQAMPGPSVKKLVQFPRRKFSVRKLCYVVALSLLAGLAFADQITLKNGDKFTGKVVKSDGKVLILHTDAAGDITIQFDAIQQISTDQELHVGLKGGKTVVGPVTTNDGKLEVTTKSGGNVEAPTADVTVIRNDAEQTAYDKSLHPGLMQGWNGGLNLGFSVARGNSQTENLALAFNAAHPTLNDKITLYANTLDTSNGLASPSTVANLEQGGIRYDRNIASRTFVFVGADFMANALQDLDLRGVYGGGFGYHVVKSDTTTLDLLGGLNYTHETYSNGPLVTPPTTPPTYESYGFTHRYAALTLGQELTHKAGANTVITESFYFFPDLKDTSQYRGTFGLGTVTKISKWLGWQNQFSDIYVSTPPEGAKKNDLIVTTGLNVSFTH